MEIRFEGRVVKGKGFYSELVIPGCSVLKNHSVKVPADWPEELRRGSLNVRITGWPEGFSTPNAGEGGAFRLDGDVLIPAFTIPGGLIQNNKLVWNEQTRRANEVPLGASGVRSPAKVWRATLQVPGTELNLSCWVLRRLGSKAGAGSELEIVSHEHIREIYRMPETLDHPAVLILFEGC